MMGSVSIAGERLLMRFIASAFVGLLLLVFAPAAVWQVVKTSAIVSKEVASTDMEIGEAVDETCGEVNSGIRDSLDPICL